MKVIVDWSARFTSEIVLPPSDLEKIQEAGISLDDGQAIAKWVSDQEWLAEDAKDSIIQTTDFETVGIEVQDDNGTVVL